MTTALLLVLAAAPVHRFALVVGSNTGEGVRAAPLRFADDDAVAMHELLLEAGVESVLLASPDADTRRLHPRTAPLAPPTLDALKGAFAAQRASMERAHSNGERVEWLFVFSGHGDVEDGVGFLGLEVGRLTRAVLHDELVARAPAAVAHVVIDACRSGALVASKGPGGLRLPMPAVFAPEPSWPPSVGFVLSASSAKDSHEWEKWQAGVFSYEVRSALRGAADADRDGAVSYAELGAFLETANAAIENPRLRPDFLSLPPGGKPGLGTAVLAWSLPGVLGPVAEPVYLERANGERLLDVNSAPGHVTRLQLPPERPLYVRSKDERRELVLASAEVQLAALGVGPSAPAARGSVDRALDRLFLTPFDEGQVSRYAEAWAPPELASFAVAGPPRAAMVARSIAAISTLAGVAMGVTGFSLGWSQQGASEQLDQRARLERNRLVGVGNAIGVAGLVVAAVSAATWLVLGAVWELPVFGVLPAAEGPVAAVSWTVSF
ncbi:MAG: caspase family protein [Myxococcaceae bacterium]|nr:caspase family protein [Myxococcaceae bacterium]